MACLRRFVMCALLAGMVCPSIGCSFFHELNPHRLWRMNRYPDPNRDVNFSVTDPVPPFEPISLRTDDSIQRL